MRAERRWLSVLRLSRRWRLLIHWTRVGAATKHLLYPGNRLGQAAALLPQLLKHLLGIHLP